MSINVIAGPPASGMGLLNFILKRSEKIKVSDSFDINLNDENIIQFEYDQNHSLKKIIDRVLVIFRCPVSSFLCIIEGHYNRLERSLTEDELDFYASVFIKNIINMNGLIDAGAKYFILKNESGIVGRVNELTNIICGEKLCLESDIIDFYQSSETYRYVGISRFSRKVRAEVKKLGTIYAKYCLQFEF